VSVREHDLMAHWPAMVRVCESTLGSREDAEDCAATALLGVVQRGGLSEVANGEAWMVAVARRRAVDVLRGRDRERRRGERLAAHTAGVTPVVAEHVADRAEAQWLASVAREGLPHSTQRLLEALAEGFPIDEAAAQLEISKRAAESHLHRARRALRAAWASTLAVWGVLVAAARRAAPAAPAAALAASTLALAVSTPAPAGEADPALRPQPVLEREASTAVVPRAETSASGRALVEPAPAAVPVHALARQRQRQLPTAVGVGSVAVSVSEKERSGPSDPVGVVLHCLSEMEVSATTMGC
jgi:RNA polymerase sigma factor (sigma-70 family)